MRLRGDEEVTLLRRVGCVVQLAALVTLVGLLVTYLHARSLVLYGPVDQPFEQLSDMSFLRRVGVFLSGHQRPRPQNLRTPGDLELLFRRVEISGENPGQRLDAWFLPHEHPEGLAIVLHDYGQSKADLLEVAVEFHDLRFAVFMPDLRASGDSEGQETSFGWHEADDLVRVALRANDYQPAGGLRVIYGLGSGAAAALRAVAELKLEADALILEGVYADLLDVFSGYIGATSMMTWPVARISRFWAGYTMGFPAAQLKPVVYAAQVSVPTLLLVGREDTEGMAVGEDEGAAHLVEKALAGPRELRVVPGGRPIARTQPEAWFEAVQTFLARVPPHAESPLPADTAPMSYAPDPVEHAE